MSGLPSFLPSLSRSVYVCVRVCLGREKRKEAVLPSLCRSSNSNVQTPFSTKTLTHKKNAPICLLQKPSHPPIQWTLSLFVLSVHAHWPLSVLEMHIS